MWKDKDDMEKQDEEPSYNNANYTNDANGAKNANN